MRSRRSHWALCWRARRAASRKEMSQEKEAEDEKLTRPQCTDAVPNPMQLASLLHSTGAQGDVEAFVGSEHVMPTVEGFAEYRNLVTMFEECASAVTYSDYDDFRISVYKSAALFALPKPDDSPRPIVCASVFSRCFADLACASVRLSHATPPPNIPAQAPQLFIHVQPSPCHKLPRWPSPSPGRRPSSCCATPMTTSCSAHSASCGCDVSSWHL